MKKINELNWSGFTVMVLMSIAGALANNNINSFIHGFFVVLFIGVPLSLFFLFM